MRPPASVSPHAAYAPRHDPVLSRYNPPVNHWLRMIYAALLRVECIRNCVGDVVAGDLVALTPTETDETTITNQTGSPLGAGTLSFAGGLVSASYVGSVESDVLVLSVQSVFYGGSDWIWGYNGTFLYTAGGVDCTPEYFPDSSWSGGAMDPTGTLTFTVAMTTHPGGMTSLTLVLTGFPNPALNQGDTVVLRITRTVTGDLVYEIRAADSLARSTYVYNDGIQRALIYEGGGLVGIVQARSGLELPMPGLLAITAVATGINELAAGGTYQNTWGESILTFNFVSFHVEVKVGDLLRVYEEFYPVMEVSGLVVLADRTHVPVQEDWGQDPEVLVYVSAPAAVRATTQRRCLCGDAVVYYDDEPVGSFLL